MLWIFRLSRNVGVIVENGCFALLLLVLSAIPLLAAAVIVLYLRLSHYPAWQNGLSLGVVVLVLCAIVAGNARKVAHRQRRPPDPQLTEAFAAAAFLQDQKNRSQ